MSEQEKSSTIVSPRREVLRVAGGVTLSAGAVMLLAGCQSMGSTTAMRSDPAKDTAILNVALGLEHEAIAAYQLGAESRLLTRPVLQVAVLFQSHHKQHRDALTAAITRMGGRPVAAKSMQEYATALNAASLQSAGDILALATKLERAAANAYLGVIPSFQSEELRKVAGRLAADETMHFTALAQATNAGLPDKALSFGA
jgi:rubrerythrin